MWVHVRVMSFFDPAKCSLKDKFLHPNIFFFNVAICMDVCVLAMQVNHGGLYEIFGTYWVTFEWHVSCFAFLVLNCVLGLLMIL